MDAASSLVWRGGGGKKTESVGIFWGVFFIIIIDALRRSWIEE